MTPPYLRDNLPRLRRLLFGSCISNKYHELFFNKARYINSFSPDSIKIWNNIGIDFHTCTSLSSFKKNILNLIRSNSKPVYGVYDPVSPKRLFQLRVQLSPLECHKQRHNFIDTPCDWCDCHWASEDTKDFLFHCTLFAAPRLELQASVSSILVVNKLVYLTEDVNFYLYGHDSLKFADKRILLSTIKYIKETGRFP